MLTENRSSTVSHFQREDRYIVIKRSDLKKVPVSYRSALVDPMLSLLSHLPHRERLVIESDWPEFEPTWAAIEARMAGNPVGQRQGKPVHMMRSHGSCCWEESSGESLDIALSMPEEYEVRALYTHPAPADAGEVERLVSANTEYARRHLEQQAEVERLRGAINEWQSKWESEAARCGLLLGRLAERDALLKNAEKVIEQFMPNVGKCFGINFALLNETLVELRAALSASAPAERKPA